MIETLIESEAGLRDAAMLAQQSLRGIAGMEEGQTLLINGAGGGVGTLGLQLAKLHGIEVTGVDSTESRTFFARLASTTLSTTQKKISLRVLDGMTELLDAGKVVPSIDGIYPLSEVPDAIRRFGAARHKGKIIISVETRATI